MPPRRWLWPCADSHVLRLPAYQNPTLHACLVHPDNPDDILVSDSDDGLDDDFHTAKRQRIEAIAHSFLNGRPIYIPSATLKGPFPADRDLSLCHEPFSSPPVNPVSPPPTVTADTFIRRRPARPRPKSPTPEPTLTPSKPQQSSPPILEKPASRPQSSRQPPRSSKNKSLRFDLPSSAVSAPSTVLPPLPKFVAINKVLQTRDTPDKPPSSTAPSHTTPWFADRIPDSSFISPSPSPSKDALPALSSSKLASVLRQRPASSLNKAEKAPSSTHKLHKLSSVKKNKKPIKRVYQAAATSDTTSPFIYRRNATLARKTVVPEKDKSVECEDVVNNPSASEKQSKTPASPVKRHAVLFESSLVVPEPKLSHPPSAVAEPERSPERPQHDFVPAINMSFGQESLGMDFNIINHFNDRLPGSSANKERTDLGEGTPENQDLPVVTSAPVLGTENETLSNDKVASEEVEAQEALLERTIQEQLTQEQLTQEHLTANEMDVPSNEGNEALVPEGGNAPPQVTNGLAGELMDDTVLEDVEEAEDGPMDDMPYISTQAAIQDAHRALFDASSPLQLQEEPSELPFETPAKQVTSRASSPVHTITPFHQFNAELITDTQAPLPNTQALFDGFYSPIKLSAKKPRSTKRASFAPSIILEDADDTVASLANDVSVHENNEDHVESDLDDFSVADDQSPLLRNSVSPALPQGRTSTSSVQNPSGYSPPRSLSDRSDSPDFILSQRTTTSRRGSSGPVLPVLQQESISLSEMFDFVSSRRGVDVDTLLSQNTPTSSSKVGNKNGQKSARSSQARPRSSLPKSLSSQLKRPHSSLSKPLSEQSSGKRRSLRLSLSQPNPQTEDDLDTDIDIDGPPATQPHLTDVGLGRSFASVSSTVPDGSSTIPDPSLALNHLQQNATPASGKPACTPGSAPQSTDIMSSYQNAQKQYSSLTDLDGTMPDLPQTFLPPVR
ncbi:hypothetical protein D6C86_03393 [Aureobasidium pullulans]|uniref:Uncharacterized protein n=1 Tax=Aureobasidium pullulans TaxID=5580 RepID=A0A4S9UIE9_AURPU|nr:hypothetical protein D6C94_03608 [Aureobasidium pullulans]THZ37575.1 hypothetical protein D6C87_08400 [Aureobasidium pullulans]THZ63185.1 hypothetical protein D6C86_03393 [Aureobasidium pullulans]